jgi:hypothetical protein
MRAMAAAFSGNADAAAAELGGEACKAEKKARRWGVRRELWGKRTLSMLGLDGRTGIHEDAEWTVGGREAGGARMEITG